LTGTGYATHAVDRGTSGSETLVGRTGMAPVEMMGIMSVNNTSILRIVNSSAPKDEIYAFTFWFLLYIWSLKANMKSHFQSLICMEYYFWIKFTEGGVMSESFSISLKSPNHCP
jgi:hypothetical protein